ncbi:MAG: hypothetical protein HGA45_16475 [Chloroflexales bacterium]|nr:hypothetical protein [Chloroflexales bacterium]
MGHIGDDGEGLLAGAAWRAGHGRAAGGPVVMAPPEAGEERVEERDVLVAADQDAAAGVIHLVA